MNEALNVIPSNAFDAASLSMLRRIRGDAPAANEDDCVDMPAIDVIEAWARRASDTNGFGDAMLGFLPSASRPNADELHRNARVARSRALGEVAAIAVESTHNALGRAVASYRAYRDARETMRALRALDDRTLHDLGYHRSEIESVAIEIHVARAR